MDRFVNSQTARIHAPQPHQQPQIDPQRAELAKGAKVKINRQNVPNSGQQRHEDLRREILRYGQNAQRNVFDGSTYEGSNITSVSRVLVEDSQLDAHGRSIGHPAYYDPQYANEDAREGGNQEESDSEEEDGDEGTEGGEEEQGLQPRLDRSALYSVNAFIAKDGPGQEQAGVGLFERPQDGDSYPPTTSGRLSRKGDEPEPHEPYSSAVGAAYTGGPIRRDSQCFDGPEPPVQKATLHQQAPVRHVQAPQPASRQLVPSRHASLAGRATVPQCLPTARETVPLGLQMRPTTMQTAQSTRLASYPPAMPRAQFQHSGASQHAHNPKTRSNTGGSTKAESIATIVQAPAAPQYELAPIHLAAVALDHDSGELFAMSYEDLHKQSLDDDPGEHPAILAEDAASKPLAEQLKLVQKMDKEAKQVLMASLSLDQWEDAGDWFLERFGDIVNKLKDARKERRKLAKGFGDEIFHRHQRVQGKKRDIEDALDEMGKGGMDVLRAGTPKKPRV